MSFFIFGGEFPGDVVIPRLYILHVLLIPGLLLALIGPHMLLLVFHKHTQWAGPGRTEQNVVGYPMLPVYMAKAGGFFFMVFGVTALMGALLSINPIWKYGPYDPSKVTAGSQPDWYMGIAEGLLRIMPNWETHIWGLTISWNVMIPGQILPVRAVRDDHRLAVPRGVGDRRQARAPPAPAAPQRPHADGVPGAMVTVYGLLWAAGGNDILATHFHWSLNSITYFMRAAIFVIPPIVVLRDAALVHRAAARRQRPAAARLRDRHHHAVARGWLQRAAPADQQGRAYTLTARHRDQIHELESDVDENGVAAPGTRVGRIRAKLSRAMYADNVQKPTVEELEEARHHAEHTHELEAGLDHPAAGHEFDDHALRDAEDVPLRQH